MTGSCEASDDDLAAGGGEVERRLANLSEYLASLEGLVEAMRQAGIDAARERLVRDHGEAIARQLTGRQIAVDE
jgi:hypothetical protein